MNSPSPVSFSALRAFREAARTGGFRSAAQALSLTPSAVSHQVRSLERQLGAPLFTRGARTVALTPAGAALYAQLDAAFRQIEAALVSVRARGPRTLNISALASFTQTWLLPRVSRFEAQRPGIMLAIETLNRLADFEADGVDVAIRNLRAPPPGLFARKLIDVAPVVLAAPSLGLRAPADLAGATLIHIAPRIEAWPQWLAAAGVPGLAPSRNLTVDTIPAALEAAAAGQGVALVWSPLAWDTPAAARLEAPFVSPPDLGAAFYVVCQRAARADADIAAFIDWICAEMASDKRRLMRLARLRERGPASQAPDAASGA
ncbi:MAG: LysR substrate-binding domain-containing protein [Hyphomonadaceae bacterium]|nr:LysR substrate-binding domain-containing protein [Hyphomonadaceae bacterium]